MMACDLPGGQDALPSAITIEGTNIEIVRPFDGRRLRKALFDFDGTLSLERDGWINLMVACNSAALLQAVEISPQQAVNWVIGDIQASIGVPTYVQMKRLADHITQQSGTPRSPLLYKGVYNDALVAMVQDKHAKLRAGGLSQSDFRVSGSLDLLQRLVDKMGVCNLYLASGTDLEPVLRSVELLGYRSFFRGSNVLAAGATENPDQCAKELVVNRLLSEHNLGPGELVCFGDGVPELLCTYRAGGVCVGVLTPDRSNYEGRASFTKASKRKRLVKAGAHILVPDFSCAGQLVHAIFLQYP